MRGNIMTRHGLGLLTALCLCILGCDNDVYEIQLRPRNQLIYRKLTVFHGGYDTDESGQQKKRVKFLLPKETLDKLVVVYGKKPTLGPKDVSVFEGEFSREMPNDVGGFGNYTYLPTAMGSATLYTERFGGDIDIAGNIESGFEAADLLADILIGWLGGQFETRREWPKLREFLDTQFRNDLKNISAYFWTITNQPSHYKLKVNSGLTNPIIENFMRLGAYMVERGYIEPAEIKSLFETLSRKPSPELNPILIDILGEKVGLEDKLFIGEVASVLTSMNQPASSLETYLTESEFGEKLQVATETFYDHSDEPTNVELLGTFVSNLLFHSGGPATRGKVVRVTLALPSKPEITNGRWDAKTSKLHWPATNLPNNPTNWPVFIFATWSQPDENFQRIHFSKVVLTDNRLFDYCLWRENLPAHQARQFDEFIVSLTPDETLIQRLESFHFDREPTAAPAGEPGKVPPKPYELSEAKDQIQAILAALYGKKKVPPTAKPTKTPPATKPAAPPTN